MYNFTWMGSGRRPISRIIFLSSRHTEWNHLAPWGTTTLTTARSSGEVAIHLPAQRGQQWLLTQSNFMVARKRKCRPPSHLFFLYTDSTLLDHPILALTHLPISRPKTRLGMVPIHHKVQETLGRIRHNGPLTKVLAVTLHAGMRPTKPGNLFKQSHPRIILGLQTE